MSIDQITFNIEEKIGDNSQAFLIIKIQVNVKKLIHIIKEIEEPMAQAEGSIELAGNYDHLEKPEDPIAHFLGNSKKIPGMQEGEIQLLECDCGVPECWPLFCEIQLTETLVIWKNFRQPHYSQIKEFHFKRQQYMEALKRIEK